MINSVTLFQISKLFRSILKEKTEGREEREEREENEGKEVGGS